VREPNHHVGLNTPDMPVELLGPRRGLMTMSWTTGFPQSAIAQAADWPLPLNQRNQCDGRGLLAALQPESVPLRIFDPQYRSLLDKMRYRNGGVSRGRRRSALPQMSEEIIGEFISGVSDALIQSGHLFLRTGKCHLCKGIGTWMGDGGLEVVDLVTWNKSRMGMGYRTRRVAEYLPILHKPPTRVGLATRRHSRRRYGKGPTRRERSLQAREPSGPFDRGGYRSRRRGD